MVVTQLERDLKQNSTLHAGCGRSIMMCGVWKLGKGDPLQGKYWDFFPSGNERLDSLNVSP